MKQFIKRLKQNILVTALMAVAITVVHSNIFAQDNKTLLGAGSTFIYPLFSKMFAEYNTQKGIQVNYQSIGSGGGILQLTNKTVDFGASDAPLNDDQTKK